MIKTFTFKRENMGTDFDTSELSAWMAENPGATIVSTSNSDWVLFLIAQLPVPVPPEPDPDPAPSP